LAKGLETGLEQGRQEGLTKGLETGLEQGRQEGQLAVVNRLLERRFGVLAPRVKAKLKKLSRAQLEGLTDALLDFRSKADLDAWLAQNNGG
jgi:flagellar biosynthesis/type III secretory pathway protein FliH